VSPTLRVSGSLTTLSTLINYEFHLMHFKEECYTIQVLSPSL